LAVVSVGILSAFGFRYFPFFSSIVLLCVANDDANIMFFPDTSKKNGEKFAVAPTNVLYYQTFPLLFLAVSGKKRKFAAMMNKLNINQWAEEDRPREKMERLGAQALSDAELLAILIGSGSPKEDAVSLMKRILNDCNNNLNTLGKKSIHDLCQYNGVGPAKAITIMAACELGKRRQQEKAEERPDLGTATRIYNHMHPLLQDKDVEEFWILLLNQNHRLIKKSCIAHGGISEVSVDIRIIMREAVLCNATILAVCHNHPSGSIRPSQQDNSLTTSIEKACQVMRIHFMDHVIVADGYYYSYHEEGKC